MAGLRLLIVIGGIFALSACNDVQPETVVVIPTIQADGGIGGAGLICRLHMERVSLPDTLDRDSYLAAFQTVTQRWWNEGGTDAEMATYAALTPSFDDSAVEDMIGNAASPLLENCLTLAAAAPEIMGLTR